MKNLILLFLTIFVIGSCGSKKVINPSDALGKKLILSHGGGFTGNYNTYQLLENGQLFKSTKTAGVNTAMKNLKKDITTQIFANYDALNLAAIKNVTYGNLLYSITMIDNDKKHVVSWEKGQKGSETLQLYYRNVMNLIKIHSEGQVSPEKSKIKAKF